MSPLNQETGRLFFSGNSGLETLRGARVLGVELLGGVRHFKVEGENVEVERDTYWISQTTHLVTRINRVYNKKAQVQQPVEVFEAMLEKRIKDGAPEAEIEKLRAEVKVMKELRESPEERVIAGGRRVNSFRNSDRRADQAVRVLLA